MNSERLFLLLALFFFSFTTIYCTTSANGGVRTMTENSCIKKYNITRGTSPWQGFTSSAKEEEDSKKISAVTLQGSSYKSVPSLEKFSKSGNCIIGRSETLRRVAVDSSLFSNLNRADATRRTDGRFLIGKCKDALFKLFAPAVIADFLIQSQIVNTFWHVESDFCLYSEKDSPDFYSADYKGKHTYFTNQKNEEALDFTITIEKKTGNMYLEAR